MARKRDNFNKAKIPPCQLINKNHLIVRQPQNQETGEKFELNFWNNKNN